MYTQHIQPASLLCSLCRQKTFVTRKIWKHYSTELGKTFTCAKCGCSNIFISLVCLCGNKFLAYPSEVRKGIKSCCRGCHNKLRLGTKLSSEWCRNMSKGHRGNTKRIGPKHYRWKEGRTLRQTTLPSGTKIAYYYVRCYRVHNGRIISVKKPEHRLLMEQLIGRKLTRSEVVHHINHNSLDNRPSNLMLLPNQSSHLKHHFKHGRLHKGNHKASPSQ